MSTPITTWDTNRRWVRTCGRGHHEERGWAADQGWAGHTRGGAQSCPHSHTGPQVHWGAAGGGTPFPTQLLGSYAPKIQACVSLLAPNLMPHHVPEDGQEGPLEEDAELCEGAGGKGVALNGIHFLGRGNRIR